MDISILQSLLSKSLPTNSLPTNSLPTDALPMDSINFESFLSKTLESMSLPKKTSSSISSPPNPLTSTNNPIKGTVGSKIIHKKNTIFYIKCIIVGILLYLELTIGEIIIHKYLMHNKEGSIARKIWGNSHNTHHLDVKHDMKLEEHHRKEGLFFNNFDVIGIALLVFSVWYPTLRLFFKVTWYKLLFVSTLIGIFYQKLWDFLHYSFHQEKKIDKYIKNPIFYWLFHNHSMHHLVKGKHKGNYNIIFPGGDFIFGTYRTKINNKEYCKNPHEKHIGYCKMEEDKAELPFNFKWED